MLLQAVHLPQAFQEDFSPGWFGLTRYLWTQATALRHSGKPTLVIYRLEVGGQHLCV